MQGIRITLKAAKPKKKYPPPQTIGEHIRERRRALSLFQKDAAKQLGVTQATVLNWEKNKTEVPAKSYPAIIAFLGYDPSSPATTIGERLKAARQARGWSINAGAAALGVDPATLADWERGKTILYREHRRLVAGFIGIDENEVHQQMAEAWNAAHGRRVAPDPAIKTVEHGQSSE